MCHRMDVQDGMVKYVRTDYPSPGDLHAQDPQLIAKFGIIEQELLDLEVERNKDRRAESERKAQTSSASKPTPRRR